MIRTKRWLASAAMGALVLGCATAATAQVTAGAPAEAVPGSG